jgi:predicted secreted hydrolase
MAHAALTDPEAGQHFANEKFAREAMNLAGVHQDPFNIWVGDSYQADITRAARTESKKQ